MRKRVFAFIFAYVHMCVYLAKYTRKLAVEFVGYICIFCVFIYTTAQPLFPCSSPPLLTLTHDSKFLRYLASIYMKEQKQIILLSTSRP